MSEGLAADGGTPAPGNDPRAMGPSEFSSSSAPTVPAHGGPPPSPTLANEMPASTRLGETSTVAGSVLYALAGYWGLQVVQLAGTPERLAQVPISGDPFALFVREATALAVMHRTLRLVPCPTCAGGAQAVEGSSIAAVDIGDPARAALVGTLPIEGRVVRAHLAGARLLLLVRQGTDWAPVADGQPHTTLFSIDVSQPAALRVLGRFDVLAPQWVDEMSVAPGVAYLGVYGRRYWGNGGCQPLEAASTSAVPDADGCTRLQAVDLETMQAGAAIEVPGRLLPGTSNHHEGTLRALFVSSAGRQDSDRLLTFSAGSAAQLAPLGSLVLPAPRSWDPWLRFEGTRVYVRNSGPLLVIDLTRPQQPVLGAPLPTVGSVSSILGSTPTRLVTSGIEPLSPPCAQRELAVFDIQDPARPVLLARHASGSLGPAADFRVNEGEDLLLVPFTATRTPELPPGSMPPAGVRLIDVDLASGTLSARGQTLLAGQGFRLLRAGDRAVSLSFIRAEVLDPLDRDNPRVLAEVELSRWVADVKMAGQSVVEVVEDHERRTFWLSLLPGAAPDGAPVSSTSRFEGRPGPLFTQGARVYVFWRARVAGGEEPRLDVWQVESGVMQPRGSLSLAGPAEPDLEGSDQDRFAQQVRQVGGTTFLVPLRRVRDCTPPVTAPASPAPSCGQGGGASAPTTPPAVPLPPPPPPTSAAPPPATMTPATCPGQDADFLVVDASQAEDPRIASRLRLGSDAEVIGSIAQGQTVFVTQREKTQQADRTERLRFFVSEIGLQDPLRPQVGVPVNVPGGLVAARAADQTWITVEPIFQPQGPPSGVTVNVLYRDPVSNRAFLQHQLPLMGGVSGPLSADSTLFFTVDGSLTVVDPFDAAGPRVLSRTPVLDASVSGVWGPLGTGFPSRPPNDTGTYPLPANVQGVIGGNVFVRYGRGTLVYDARDRARPQRLDHLFVTDDRTPIRSAPGDRVMVPRENGWGLETATLPP